MAKKKQKWFKDSPDGIQLHAGTFRDDAVWHSDDGGETWWSGHMFSHDSNVTREELVKLATTILREVDNDK